MGVLNQESLNFLITYSFEEKRSKKYLVFKIYVLSWINNGSDETYVLFNIKFIYLSNFLRSCKLFKLWIRLTKQKNKQTNKNIFAPEQTNTIFHLWIIVDIKIHKNTQLERQSENKLFFLEGSGINR